MTSTQNIAEVVEASANKAWAGDSGDEIVIWLRRLWKRVLDHPNSSKPAVLASEKEVAQILETLDEPCAAVLQQLLKVHMETQLELPAPGPAVYGGVASDQSGELTLTLLDVELNVVVMSKLDAAQLARHLVDSSIELIAIDEAISRPVGGAVGRLIDKRLRAAGIPSRRILDWDGPRSTSVRSLVRRLARSGLKRIGDPGGGLTGVIETSSAAICSHAVGGPPGAMRGIHRIQLLKSLGVAGLDRVSEVQFRSGLAAWVASLAADDRCVGFGSDRNGWLLLPASMEWQEPDFVSGLFPLPASARSKGMRYTRWLRREILRFWYATIEDREAAAISAVAAAIVVNTLDESVFEEAHGDSYREFRSRDRGGLAVEGLELIRNCEIHAPIAEDQLLVDQQMYGMWVGSSFRMRGVPAWAPLEDLSIEYTSDTRPDTDRNNRARGPVRSAYRSVIENRSVVETLFDALDFFERLDGRLRGAPPLALEFSHAYQALPTPDGKHLLAMPLELDRYEVYLPDLVSRSQERRMASWGASDRELERKAKEVRGIPPSASLRRRVTAVLLSSKGKRAGLSGITDGHVHGMEESWIESRGQVFKDIKRGYQYFVVAEDGTETVLSNGANGVVSAVRTGIDVLLTMTIDPDRTDETISFYGSNPDLYLKMRTAEQLFAGTSN